MKKIIAVDIDDVLVPHFQDLIDWYNERYDTKLTLGHNGKGDLTAWGATSREEAIKRVHGFFDSAEFRQARPFEEAVTLLKMLAKTYELVVVTARDSLLEEFTHDWLKNHFGDIFAGVHFTAKYSLHGKSRSKPSVLNDIGAAYFIDDQPEHIQGAAESGVRCVLFGEYPWAITDILPDNVVRCRDWAAVREYFDDRDD